MQSTIDIAVLIIGNDSPIRGILEDGLRASDCRVSLAGTGDDGLNAVALLLPDIALLVLPLSDMDGLDVVRHLRRWSSIPIVVLSSQDAGMNRVRAFNAGADDCLTLPLGMDELLARMRVILRRVSDARASASADHVFRDGRLVIDFAARSVTLAGDAIHLTPTEYALLGELIANEGKLLTHQMLLGRVRGPAARHSAQYLRTYVNQLRAKIETDPSNPQRIINIPGVGYRYQRGGSG